METYWIVDRRYALKENQIGVCDVMSGLTYYMEEPEVIDLICKGKTYGCEGFNLRYKHDNSGKLTSKSIARAFLGFEEEFNHDENFRMYLNMEELYYYLRLTYKAMKDFMECEQEVYDTWEVSLEYFSKACDIKGLYLDRIPAQLQTGGPR